MLLIVCLVSVIHLLNTLFMSPLVILEPLTLFQLQPTVTRALLCRTVCSELGGHNAEGDHDEEEEEEGCDHYGPSYSTEEDEDGRDADGCESDNVRTVELITALCSSVHALLLSIPWCEIIS